ncbi:MAG TPA: rhodanese-like domain-containing protein [Saprospiraceae bacterium]|nr:rhodanese-like domain-containing protein [Saprospiraceae bacterium]
MAQDITAQELKIKLDNREDFILIDVREIFEHTEFNIGGELAPLQTSFPYKIETLKGSEDKEIVVYCRSGNRSGVAKAMLQNAGFSNVRNLIGGMIHWRTEFNS